MVNYEMEDKPDEENPKMKMSRLEMLLRSKKEQEKRKLRNLLLRTRKRDPTSPLRKDLQQIMASLALRN